MAEEYSQNRHEEKSHEYESSITSTADEVSATETKDRGLFDFMGKKEEKIKYPQEEVISTEFEKGHVSEPEPKVEEYKEEEEEKKHGLLEKLHRSDGSSSSPGDEKEGEGGEKKKEEEKVEERYEDTKPISVEKYDEAVNTEPVQPEEKKGFLDKMRDKLPGWARYENTTPIPVEKYDEAVYTEPAQPGEKSFPDKIKEKLPGHHKKTEEVSPTSRAADCAAAESYGHEGEPKEKKGILEKIKNKIPGYHPKTEEEKEKEKE